jgi:hypothetical protein
MNTIKTFKSKIAYILSIVFLLSAFSSCTSDDIELKAERKFDLSTAKEGLKIVKTLPKVNYKKFKSGNEIDKIGLTKAINNQVGENVLDIRVFDNINTYKKSTENELDTEILESFSIDWENNGIDNAILNLNNLLNEKNVDNTVFEKYNSFSNILLLSEINFQNQAKNSNYQAKNGWRCALKIAKFTLSTVAVGTTCVPNPSTPFACPIAVGYAVIAYAEMLIECAE